jgi:hypothetical protein
MHAGGGDPQGDGRGGMMSGDRQFPILTACRQKPGCPSSIPWRWLAQHETQARQNHNQTLERLAERGGMSPQEIWYVIHDMQYPWGESRTAVDEPTAIRYLNNYLATEKGESFDAR